MKILTYDEVDHDQVFYLHMSAFGEPYEEGRVRAMIRRDRRIPEYFGLYAVEGDEIAGLVLPWRIPTRTREATEDILGIDDLATRATRARSGVATMLMTRAEEMAVEEGVRFCWLTTSSHLVGHHLYHKLGYFDASCIPHSLKHIPPGAEKPPGVKFRAYRKSDGETLTRLHRSYVEGSFGFTERQERFIDVRIATRHISRQQVRVATRAGKVVGYAVLRMQGRTPNVREVVASSERDFKAILAGVEAGSKSPYVMAWCIYPEKQRRRFRDAGYPVYETDWWRLMVKTLDRSVSREEIEHLYGLDDGSFAIMALDVF